MTGTHEINKWFVSLSRRIRMQTLLGQLAESGGSFPLSHYQGHPFQVRARSCWPGSSVSPRIRQQPVWGLAGGLEAWLTNMLCADRQTDKQTLLGLDGTAIWGRVHQSGCSQLKVSLSDSNVLLQVLNYINLQARTTSLRPTSEQVNVKCNAEFKAKQWTKLFLQTACALGLNYKYLLS